MKSKNKINIELICQFIAIALVFGIMIAFNATNKGIPVGRSVRDTLLASLLIAVGSTLILAPYAIVINYLAKRRKRLRKAKNIGYNASKL